MQPAHRLSFFGKALPFLGAAALGIAAVPSVSAQTVLTDTHTLNGTFFQDSAANVVSISQAQAFIGGRSPTGTFTSSQSVLTSAAGYSGRDFSSPQDFLGSDGRSYVGTTTNLEDGIFDFKGFLDVTTPNTYTFSTGSDDGSALFIDGKTVVSNDSIAPEHFTSGTDQLNTGLHSVEVLYYNHIFEGGQGGANLTANFNGLNLTNSNNPVSAAPEPSAIAVWTFIGLGAAGLAFKARKRKAVAA